jgi:hypothetical protein
VKPTHQQIAMPGFNNAGGVVMPGLGREQELGAVERRFGSCESTDYVGQKAQDEQQAK